MLFTQVRNSGKYAGTKVEDYSTETIDEEQEGRSYYAEKRIIRETVDIPDAKIFTWGDGQYGKLGHQTLDSLYVPYAVTALQRCVIRMCALGKDHSLFLTNEGIVMASGSNGYGQLGIGQGQDARSIPTLINGLNDVKSLSAGHYHSMALNSAGNLYAWGSGSWGKLGLSSDANCATPRLVSALKSVPTRSVACGGHHTVAITVAGDVWTWGKGLHGQLGHNSVKVCPALPPHPRLVASKAGCQAVVCSGARADHCIIICIPCSGDYRTHDSPLREIRPRTFLPTRIRCGRSLQ